MRRNDWLLAGATVLAALGLMLAFFLYPRSMGNRRRRRAHFRPVSSGAGRHLSH